MCIRDRVGPQQMVSPFCDLDKDGKRELLLVSTRAVFLSSSGLIEMALSRGFDMMLSIREYHPNGYLLKPDATLEITVMPTPDSPETLFILDGDFNGDGRVDLLARRSYSEWHVYFSSTRGGWFQEKPGLKFQVPFEGQFLLRDLNKDKRTDLVIESNEDSRMCVFLSPANRQEK